MRWQHVFAALLLVWLGQNLASAMLVEVMSDEAYYWLWGRHLAWGYYDHPPVVAAMTCISSMLFEGNLSVRFFSIISQTLTLVIIWLLVGEKQPSVRRVLLFFAIAASMIMFAAYGFVAAPDVGLLLFAALFLFFYQKYLVRSTWMAALGMGIAMAAMLYSKYHGFLVIAFVVLSNPKLLLQRRVWFAAVLAALLFMPHIAWQAAHGFPSLQYHTAGRSSAFRMAYLLEYLPNQLVVFNPFVVGAIVLILVKYRRVKDAFVRSLHYLTTGIIIFFWVMCIRGHVEPHWTVVCSIPMIILLYRHSMENVRMLNYVKRFVLPSILIVLIARILLTTQALPQRLGFWGKAARFSALYHAVSDNRQQTTDNRG
jgi:4-amino-4-deoxy-L-arabinose transferase-like glycosyltransferase